MLYLATLAAAGTATSREVLQPAVDALLAFAEPATAERAAPLLSLFYTETLSDAFEVSMQNGAAGPVEGCAADFGMAERCDAAVQRAEQLFRHITGEDELFVAGQDDVQPGEED